MRLSVLGFVGMLIVTSHRLGVEVALICMLNKTLTPDIVTSHPIPGRFSDQIGLSTHVLMHQVTVHNDTTMSNSGDERSFKRKQRTLLLLKVIANETSNTPPVDTNSINSFFDGLKTQVITVSNFFLKTIQKETVKKSSNQTTFGSFATTNNSVQTLATTHVAPTKFTTLYEPHTPTASTLVTLIKSSSHSFSPQPSASVGSNCPPWNSTVQLLLDPPLLQLPTVWIYNHSSSCLEIHMIPYRYLQKC